MEITLLARNISREDDNFHTISFFGLLSQGPKIDNRGFSTENPRNLARIPEIISLMSRERSH